jgi:3-hydroxyisobutyrate dehydrogenase-like beta-hydroxyacid dehydrogenase
MKITFIGLGKMGSAMVKRLLNEGYTPTVYNRTLSKITPLLNLGALPSKTLADATQNSEVIMSCLLDDASTLNVTMELLNYIPKNAIHISLSTLLPETAKELAKLHQQHGSHFVSATVLGIPEVAENGRLTTFCAGNAKALKQILPLLNALSQKVTSLGETIHLPNVMKICMNYSLMTAIELISELYVFAEKSGLDTELVKIGLHQIYGHPGFKHYIDKIYQRNFDEVHFDIIGGNKDVSLFQKAFSQVGVVPELANVAKSRFISALKQGKENKDWSSIYEVVRTQAGLSQNTK